MNHKYVKFIDDYEFMKWCDIHRENHEVVNMRYAYLLVYQQGLTRPEAAHEMGVQNGAVYRRISKYMEAVEEYIRERDALKHRNNDFKL